MKFTFESLAKMIEMLHNNPLVIAIIEYGNRKFTDMSYGGDYDFFIIVDNAIKTEIDGFHFHVRHIPIDCTVRTLNDLSIENPVNSIDHVIFKGRILFDKSNKLISIISEAKSKWKSNTNSLSYGDIQWERFSQQHVIDKFEHRLFENETYSHMHLNMNINWLFENYIKIKYKEYKESKIALTEMKHDEPELYSLFTEFHTTLDLNKKHQITIQLTNKILEPIGGPWKKGEIIFQSKTWDNLISNEEKDILINQLFLKDNVNEIEKTN